MSIVGNLIIEVTRSCNMQCCHCLRGEPQRKRIKPEYIDTVVRKFNWIDTITFTGGEPSLNCDAIEHFVWACRSAGVRFENYYIATNAKRITKRFLDVIRLLHNHAGSNEISSVDVSNDDYHDSDWRSQVWKLDELKEMELPGFNWNFKIPKQLRFSPRIIAQGRAESWGDRENEAEKFILRKWDGEIYIVEGTLYLNCKGNVVSGCDWSYKEQDKKKNIICPVDDFSDEKLLAFGELEKDYEAEETERVEALAEEATDAE